LVSGTTTPTPAAFCPTARQLVGLEHATPKKKEVPATGVAVPGTPLVSGTTTPPEALYPTARQLVALEHPTP
jgi:hypothetical protein